MLSHYFISTLRTQSNVEKNPDIAASLKDEITTLKLKRTNIVYRYFPIIGELWLFFALFRTSSATSQKVYISPLQSSLR